MKILLNSVKLFTLKNVLFLIIAFNLVISLKSITIDCEALPKNLYPEPSTSLEPSTTAEFSITAESSIIAEPTFKIDDFIKNDSIKFGHPADNVIKIAAVSCGQGIMEQTLVMMKSAIIFAQSNLHFIIIAEDNKRDICQKVSNLNCSPILQVLRMLLGLLV
jgi:hypothetical protein